MDITHKNARYLRNNMTKQERIMWILLRKRRFHNYRFLRQYPIGRYIVDFVCLEKKIVIEIDGLQHNEEEQVKYDDKRTKYLESKGYKVLRYWNSDIDKNLQGVYDSLTNAFGIES